MKAAKVSIKFERYCFQLNPSALKCTINNGTVVRNQNITFVIYAGCLTTLYGKRLTVPRFVRLLPLVPSAADAETYITRKNNAQILNIQVTGELGSENAAAWSLWFHPRKLFVALKNVCNFSISDFSSFASIILFAQFNNCEPRSVVRCVKNFVFC